MRALRLILLIAILLLAGCSAAPPAAEQATALPATASVPATPVPTEPAAPSATPAPTETASPEPVASPTPVPAEEPTAEPDGAVDIIADYAGASFRPIAVVKNPSAPYTVIVAAERAPLSCGSQEAPQRCWADDLCGSMYTSRACYFFVEPTFDAAADPQTRFVAQWPEVPGVNALQPDTIRFVDAETLEFTAPGGDGGYSVEEVWQLDLASGELTLVSRVEQSVDSP